MHQTLPIKNVLSSCEPHKDSSYQKWSFIMRTTRGNWQQRGPHKLELSKSCYIKSFSLYARRKRIGFTTWVVLHQIELIQSLYGCIRLFLSKMCFHHTNHPGQLATNIQQTARYKSWIPDHGWFQPATQHNCYCRCQVNQATGFL